MENKQIGTYRKHSARSVKTLIVVLCAALIIGTAITGSVAWLVSESEIVKNEFTPGKVTTVIEENFDGEEKTDVKITNTGNVPAYIRVALVCAWVDEDGNVVALPASLNDCEITWGTGWFNASDNFYYCETPVQPGESTPVLINICVVSGEGHEYDFELRILASAVQTLPATVVEGVWPVVVDGNGNLAERGASEGGNG